MDTVVKMPVARLSKARINRAKLPGAPEAEKLAVSQGVSNLLTEIGGNLLLENGGVILIK